MKWSIKWSAFNSAKNFTVGDEMKFLFFLLSNSCPSLNGELKRITSIKSHVCHSRTTPFGHAVITIKFTVHPYRTTVKDGIEGDRYKEIVFNLCKFKLTRFFGSCYYDKAHSPKLFTVAFHVSFFCSELSLIKVNKPHIPYRIAQMQMPTTVSLS